MGRGAPGAWWVERFRVGLDVLHGTALPQSLPVPMPVVLRLGDPDPESVPVMASGGWSRPRSSWAGLNAGHPALFNPSVCSYSHSGDRLS